MGIWQDMQACLDRMAGADLLRRPAVVESSCGTRVKVSGREVVSLCSNDYLNLASDPAVTEAAAQALRRWGLGAGASRLISGTTCLHEQLEERLAAFKAAQAVIVTSTGWMANHVAVHTLVGAGDLVLCDKLSHASIIDAARTCGAHMRTYRHRETERLERLLERHRSSYRRCLIATDSLFSMDGDLAPLGELVRLKRRFDAQLLIDEAHATGVLGDGGRGAAELLGVEDDIDATVGTLSKALGALGGFVAGRRVLIETIRNTGRAFMYTTALPAVICAAAVAALDVILDQPARRARLLELAQVLRSRLAEAGFAAGEGTSQIVPILVGRSADALRLARELLERGFLVPAIRPPTVPRGTSRLRVSLSAGHDRDDVLRFVELLSEIRRAGGISFGVVFPSRPSGR